MTTQNNSLVDVYLDEVWDYYPDEIENAFPFDIYPAWYVYVIDTFQRKRLLGLHQSCSTGRNPPARVKEKLGIKQRMVVFWSC